MQYGLNSGGNKIQASFTGQRAMCPLCNTSLVAYCGEVYVNHWKHERYMACDAWFEHETFWHREWKEHFPKEWREVIISGTEPFKEKHIADIKTDKGLVIEFQNSSISTTERRTREYFYESMIWVINAETFADNFKLRSAVKSELRRLE